MSRRSGIIAAPQTGACDIRETLVVWSDLAKTALMRHALGARARGRS